MRAGVAGRNPLGIIEIGRDRDDDILDLAVEILLRLLDQPLEDDGRDLLGGVLLAVVLEQELVLAAHELFDELDDVFGLDLGHVLGLGAYNRVRALSK